MKIDIAKSIVDKNISNGTALIQAQPTGWVSIINSLLRNNFWEINYKTKNYPTINDIKYKYGERFDNPSYYYGGTGVSPDLSGLTVDGGSYSG